MRFARLDTLVIPEWLRVAAIVWILLSIASAVIAAIDEMAGNKQHMWIMNIVWPVTMLWAGPLGLYAYYTVGRTATHRAMMAAKAEHRKPPNQMKPFWQSVAVAATHCGSGCSLADLIVEWGVLAVPITLFGQKVFGTWLADFIAAFILGIAFQYFTIVPMKQLSPGRGLVAAAKADALSLTAWQLGMYGWMALVLFVWFSPEQLPKTTPAFWFLMQVAMLMGFVVSYPVNWWLLESGIKEVM